MSIDIKSIEAQAKAEIAKIESVAVKEYLLLKTQAFPAKTVAIIAGAAFVVGVLIGLAL